MQRRWWIVAAWISALVGLVVLTKPVDPVANELTTFLPESAPSAQAAEALARHFPDSSGLSQAVVVMERQAPADTAEPASPDGSASRATSAGATAAPAPSGRLTSDDLSAFNLLARRLRQPLPERLARDLGRSTLPVRAPADFPTMLQPNPMVSRDGEAAIAIVSIPSTYITIRSTMAVDHVRQAISEMAWPAGLKVGVTGSAGFGKDYATASTDSHRRALGVTVLAVLAILLLVYRAPLAAAAVLGTISVAAVTAHLLLTLGGRFGMHVGTAERIFVFVLLYGAGVDYSLLYFSRFRECLPLSGHPREAAARAWSYSAPTIVASAGTVIVGLLMLSAAEFRVFQTTGKAVALALLVGLAAALTLLPALAAIAHRRLFWPGRSAGAIGSGRLWTAVAGAVTRRPGLVFVASLVLLAIPASYSMRRQFSYDTLAGLGDKYEAVRALKMAKRHWPVGEITPLVMVLEAKTPQARQQLETLTARVTDALARQQSVADVRSLSEPLGEGAGSGRGLLPGLADGTTRPRRMSLTPWASCLLLAMNRPALANAAAGLLPPLEDRLRQFLRTAAGDRVRFEYLSRYGWASRLFVVVNQPAFSNATIALLAQLREGVRQLLPADVALHVSGATAEISDLRQVTQRDFYRVALLTLIAVFVVVLALLRDWVLGAMMVASTVLSYLATLGATWWFFTVVMGQAGLDWKVEVFLFVIMVAVGQDYNIFLAARLAEESVAGDVRQAARMAIIQTGGIISSAGVIMAASLGSLAAGDLTLLVQLGFAFALGMLVDTFLVRPLLLPSLAVLTGRTGRPIAARR